MLTRRELLSTAMAGSAAFVAGVAVTGIPAARAFTFQPMTPDVAADYARGCGVNPAGHDQLLQSARATLQGEIARGLKPAGAEEIVTCPICGCRIAVTVGN